ncbi:MAG: ATP-dependent DNA helicase RecG [Muribaculaceae bacterium]|nr:ATP-dependent DNA helicase RecG [Muribaculaceae bacterium]MDE7369237.1 ATP-dependent DNA helicase RecG [Muribaculaceae bacterium]
MNSLRRIDIKYLKGVGPKRADLIGRELGIKTYYDLLHHFPSHYVDRSKIYRIVDLRGEMPALQIKGKFLTFNVVGEGAKSRLIGLFTDGTATIEIVWFRRISQIKQAYKTGNEYILFGKPGEFNGTRQMVHPEIDPVGSTTATGGLRGVYPLTEKLRNAGIGSRTIFTWVMNLLSTIRPVAETLSTDVIEAMKLMPLREALIAVHNPQDAATLQKARFRLKFEELFYIQLNLRRHSLMRAARADGIKFSRVGDFFNMFYERQLPFDLTGAQKRVIKEIRHDMGSGRQMNRLLQGDVGSGKTLVALMTMLIAIDNGYQACLMAPTEILATQHYQTLRQLVAPIGINVRLLTGSTRAKERREIHEGLLSGDIQLIVGTHALIEDTVKFRNLGFVVIDEQHRFGVMQRSRLWTKNNILPHVLVMTATPIPRTLAMTLYGDLDVSVIDELPPGRKPVDTMICYDTRREMVNISIGRQLAMGRQIYIVYPLISENEKLDLKSLEDGYETICETFPSYEVTYVHGKMKPAEKDRRMTDFVSGKARILVATTVIEVGVNVPNATTMVIENAERFGLSQLHQLRGRVGRGGDKSYCVLMTKPQIAKTTRERLEIMTSTNDGFIVAEADLKMRGPGDIEGTLQSGIAFDLKIANLATDQQIVQLARDKAEEVLEDDPALNKPVHSVLLSNLQENFEKAVDLSRIS